MALRDHSASQAFVQHLRVCKRVLELFGPLLGSRFQRQSLSLRFAVGIHSFQCQRKAQQASAGSRKQNLRRRNCPRSSARLPDARDNVPLPVFLCMSNLALSSPLSPTSTALLRPPRQCPTGPKQLTSRALLFSQQRHKGQRRWRRLRRRLSNTTP